MQSRIFNSVVKATAIIVILSGSLNQIFGQRGGNLGGGGSAGKTDSRMLYHDGPVMQGRSTIYIIWYGNWSSDSVTPDVISHLASALGSSPYHMINTTYPDSSGGAPNGALRYAGSTGDSYSHGSSLTVPDIQAIVHAKIDSGELLLDTTGIYLVIASPDVTDLQPDGSTFCTPGAAPHHGVGIYEGAFFKYGFLGSPLRCPTSAGPQFVGANGGLLPTPNGSFNADAMASNLARVINATVTNPVGTGWYDRYGLQNSDKCVGQFGATYTLANGARANMRLAGLDFLIQQNWVNDRKGRCTLSIVN